MAELRAAARAVVEARREERMAALRSEVEKASVVEQAAFERFNQFAPNGIMHNGSVLSSLPRMAEKARPSERNRTYAKDYSVSPLPSSPPLPAEPTQAVSPASPTSVMGTPPMPTGTSMATTPEKAAPPREFRSPFGAGTKKPAPAAPMPPSPPAEKAAPSKNKPKLSPSAVKGSNGLDMNIASLLERPPPGHNFVPAKEISPEKWMRDMKMMHQHHMLRDPVRPARPNVYSHLRD